MRVEPSVEKESVGSNSTPPTSPVFFPSSIGNDNARENINSPPPLNRRRFVPEVNMDTCFYCQKPGHWVRDCPMKSPKAPQTPPKPTSGTHDLPIIHCPCGAGACVVLVSRTSKNPDRKFYRCPHPSATNCKFFKWCDTVRSEEIVSAPTCSCGAGTCHIYKETTGPNAGRSLFVCPIKKGHGACNFVQFVDATNDLLDQSMRSSQSIVTNHDTSPSNIDLTGERDFRHQEMDIESLVLDTAEHPQKGGTISELSRKERLPVVDLQGQEDTWDEPLLRKHCKRQRHGDPKIDAFMLGSISDCPGMPRSKSGDPPMDKALGASVITSEALIHSRQAKFLRQISSAGSSLAVDSSASSCYRSSALPTTREPSTQNCLEAAIIYQILGFPFKGWCGRLVFPPSRCLTFPSPKPFFCCIFPSFDPIFVSQDTEILDAELSNMEIQSPLPVESNKPPLLTPGQTLGFLLREPSGFRSPSQTLQGNIMKESILEVFKQAALRLQDELLNLLDSMDFCDHETMLQEANSVFGALEGLVVDYQPFKEKVMGFIGHAASLAEVELSIHDDDRSSQELVDRYNLRKMQLDDISLHHAETWTALKASNERLQSLEKEASRVKDMLSLIEAELLCCVAKNTEIGARFDQITEEMFESELNVEVAYKEAEEALKLCRQREAERNVAKASFEEARSRLRQRGNISFLM